MRIGGGTLRRSGSGLGCPFLAFPVRLLTQKGCWLGRLLPLRGGPVHEASESRLALGLRTGVGPGAELWVTGLVVGPQLPSRGCPPSSYSVSTSKAGSPTPFLEGQASEEQAPHRPHVTLSLKLIGSGWSCDSRGARPTVGSCMGFD